MECREVMRNSESEHYVLAAFILFLGVSAIRTTGAWLRLAS
jgi:hypothetical protein